MPTVSPISHLGFKFFVTQLLSSLDAPVYLQVRMYQDAPASMEYKKYYPFLTQLEPGLPILQTGSLE